MFVCESAFIVISQTFTSGEGMGGLGDFFKIKKP